MFLLNICQPIPYLSCFCQNGNERFSWCQLFVYCFKVVVVVGGGGVVLV